MTGRPWTLAAALLLLLPGCALPGEEPAPQADPSPVLVEPPADGGGPAPCASTQAQQLAIGFSSEPASGAQGHAPGLHRLDERTWLWVWASYEDTQRQDRVGRVNEVQVFREPSGALVLCTRVDVLAPLEVDGQARTYDVAARFAARSPLPEGPVRFVVNWMAGCGPCGAPRSGNDTLLSPG